MFAKKPASPKPLWAVQVLTPDYLVEGYFDNDKGYVTSFLSIVMGKLPMDSLALTSARLQPTGTLTVPAGSILKWTIFHPSSVVAILPRDEASTAHVVQNMKEASARFAIPADVYAGPYVIRGAIMHRSQDVESLNVYYGTFVVQDAGIDCLLPGTRLAGLQAPYAIVHTLQVQGIALHT